MANTYHPYDADQPFLMPPSLTEWLPKDHLVYFVRDLLTEIDLSPITWMYGREERRYPPYHPMAMTGIRLYGYSTGVTSSRKLEKRCQEDVAFRLLAAKRDKLGHLILIDKPKQSP
ncbi:MAG: transposase [Ignavibacteria bacterium]|nr:transposase [Ignavibacteria bacterium]